MIERFEINNKQELLSVAARDGLSAHCDVLVRAAAL